MRSETQPYSTVMAIRLCRTAHAIFFPKFWNDKTNFTRVFVTVSPRTPWDRGWAFTWSYRPVFIEFTAWDSRLPPRCTFVVRSLLIISSRDCRKADSRDTSPRHACLGEVSRKIWLHDFAINNNGGSVPVIFISLLKQHISICWTKKLSFTSCFKSRELAESYWKP